MGKIAPVTGSADFFVLLTSSPGGAKVDAAKFVSGEEKLKPLTENLRGAKVDFAFPDDVPDKDPSPRHAYVLERNWSVRVRDDVTGRCTLGAT